MVRSIVVMGVTLVVSVLTACGGSGTDGSGNRATSLNTETIALDGGFAPLLEPPANNAQMTSCRQPAPVAAHNTITGTVKYERIPVGMSGLVYQNRVNLPARGVVVQAVDASSGQCSGEVVATALTNSMGEYGLDVPVNQSVCVQVRAQLYRSGHSSGGQWDIQLTDNTNKNAPYYLVDNTIATPDENAVRHFFAASGAMLGSSDYDQVRAAAPFAVLDTLCESIETLLVVEPQLQLPVLQVHWSIHNNTSSGKPEEGEIGGAFFRKQQTLDQNKTVLSVSNEIFLLGDEDNNTDEYDPHVISHEFAHFIVNNLSRSDAFGGAHALGDHLDMRVAFDEGFADAFAGMVLNSVPDIVLSQPEIYRDTLGYNQQFAFDFSLSSNKTTASGWYSEPSVFSIVYNLFDSVNDGTDQVALGFAPIYYVLSSAAYRNTDALTTIFSFINQLKKTVADTQAIDLLIAAEDFESINDDFASDENVLNNDIARTADSTSIYSTIIKNTTKVVCSNNLYGVHNKLGVRQYLLFDADVFKTYTFTISTVSSAFANGRVWLQILQQGKPVAEVKANTAGQEVQLELAMSGRYVLSIADLTNVDRESTGAGRRCFAIRVE